MKIPKKSTTFRLSETTRKQIKDIAENLCYSEAEVIENLVAWYFKERISTRGKFKGIFDNKIPTATKPDSNKK